MKRETAKRLLDTSDADHELLAFTAGRAIEDLATDRAFELVVQRLIEIIGEALHQAEIGDPALVDDIQNIRDIVGTRNRLIHGYDDINNSLVWDMITLYVPSLLSVVDDMLQDSRAVDE
jgi:uncharacterized protein with HEPN domain